MPSEGPERYWSEFLFSYVLVFAAGCNVVSSNPFASVSLCALIAVSTYALFNVSGAHLNPAISIAHGFAGKLCWLRVLMYVVAQVLGAILGAISYTVTFSITLPVEIGVGYVWWQALLVEFLYTCMLCFVFLCFVEQDRPSQSYGLAIGLVYFVAMHSCGHVSGAYLNPAAAVAMDFTSSFSGFKWGPLFVVVEICGAGMAAVLFKMCGPDVLEVTTGEGAPAVAIGDSLQLRVLAAYNLPKTSALENIGNASDPYVIARLGHKERRTPAAPSSVDPVWTEGNDFLWKVAPHDARVEIEVKNKLAGSAKELGSCTVWLTELTPGKRLRRRVWLLGGQGSSEIEFEMLLTQAPLSQMIKLNPYVVPKPLSQSPQMIERSTSAGSPPSTPPVPNRFSSTGAQMPPLSPIIEVETPRQSEVESPDRPQFGRVEILTMEDVSPGKQENSQESTVSQIPPLPSMGDEREVEHVLTIEAPMPRVTDQVDSSSTVQAQLIQELTEATRAEQPRKPVPAGSTPKVYSRTAKLTVEFIGTFFLVLTVGLNALSESSLPPAAAMAATLISMIAATRNISGGHFNPAVTLAVFCVSASKQNTAPGEAWSYVLVQLTSGVAAALVYMVIESGRTFSLEPGVGFGWLHVMVAEFIFTTVVAFTVLSVATTIKGKSLAEYAAIAVGLTVLGGSMAVGVISGGVLNPAVSFSVAMVRARSADGARQLWGCCLYMLSQLMGGGFAAFLFMVMHPSLYYRPKMLDIPLDA